MTQRMFAGLLAAALLGGLWVGALREPLPYVIYSPGLTADVLGTNEDDHEIVTVEGAETYHDDGELRFTTVYATEPEADVNLFRLLEAWIDGDDAIYPYDAIYAPEDTDESKQAEGAFQMVTSQDTAVAVALTELGYDVPAFPEVRRVLDGSPADGELEDGDLLISIDGTPVRFIDEVADVVDAIPDDQVTELRVRRDGEVRTVSLQREEIDGRLAFGFEMTQHYEFPVEVTFGIDPDIGGPSAGLMFSLAVYDTLTEGSMTGGQIVAGTGTLGPHGSVGPIGGIDQKIAGARDADADLFLVPADNCDDAYESPRGDMGLVRVATMSDAVDALEAYADDPEADLPQCEAPTGVAGE
ncbi:MAG: YlbL family protein [Nocardioides sp.]